MPFILVLGLYLIRQWPAACFANPADMSTAMSRTSSGIEVPNRSDGEAEFIIKAQVNVCRDLPLHVASARFCFSWHLRCFLDAAKWH